METNTQRRYMTFNKEEHPFTSNNWFRPATERMIFFAPRSMFSASAQCFMHGLTGCEDMNEAMQDMLSLFVYVYWKTYEQLFVPRIRPKKKKPDNQQSDEVQQQQDGGVGDEGVEEEEDALDRSYNTGRHTQNRGEDCLFALMEAKPHYSPGVKDVAGLSLSVNCNNPAISFGKKLFALFAKNEGRLAAELEGKKPMARPQRYHMITFERYCNLVELYTATSLPRYERDREALTNANSLIYPTSVFNVVQACKKARDAHAHQYFCDPSRYLPSQGGQTFPFPDRVYLLKHEYMRPDRFWTYLWPHITKPADKDAQRSMFLKQHLLPVDGSESEADLAARQQEEERLLSLYNQYNRIAVTGTNANDFEALKRRNASRMQQAEAQANHDIKKLSVLRRMVQADAMDEFEQVFHPDANIPDSLKAVIKWGEEYLSTHANLCMPVRKVSELSVFGDMMAIMAVQMECLFGVATAHMLLIRNWVTGLHIYTDEMFHNHCLMIGAHGIGKTFAFDKHQKLLIPGTFRKLGASTGKADTAPGNKNSLMCDFYEEVQPSLLGIDVQATRKGQNISNASNTDQVALMKMQLTCGGKYTYKSLKIDADHNRITVLHEIEANCILYCAANATLSNLSPPMLDRFCVTVCTTKERMDKGGMVAKMMMNDGILEAAQGAITRFQRTQYLACKILSLIRAGEIMPIDPGCAHPVYIQVMKRAQECGLRGTHNTRNFLKVLMCASMLRVLSVVNMLWDSELSPFKGKPVDKQHLLAAEPYLFVTMEEIVFALGLLHDLFESDIVKNVVKTMCATVLRRAVEVDKRDQPPHQLHQELAGKPGMFVDTERLRKIQENREYTEQKTMNTPLYFVIEYPVISSVEEHADGRKIRMTRPDRTMYSKSELLAKLTQEVSVKLNPKPQDDELYHALESLTKLPIKNENGEMHGTEFALDFKDGKLYLSKSVSKSFDTQTFKGIVKDVVESMTRRRKQYLYGATREGTPWIWETITATPDKAKWSPIELIDPNYFDEHIQKFSMSASVSAREGGDADANVSMSDVFSATPTYKIDTDPDRYYALKRLRSTATTAADMQGMPSVFPDIFHRTIMQAVDKSKLSKYPECFTKSVTEAKDSLKRRGHETDTLLSKKAKQMAEELGFDEADLPDEEDEDVCHDDSDELQKLAQEAMASVAQELDNEDNMAQSQEDNMAAGAAANVASKSRSQVLTEEEEVLRDIGSNFWDPVMLQPI